MLHYRWVATLIATLAVTVGSGLSVAYDWFTNDPEQITHAPVAIIASPSSSTTTTTIQTSTTTTTSSSTSTSTTTTTLPLRSWEGSIPEVYGEGSGCTQEEADIIARSLWEVGASDESVLKMLRIISRESLCDPSAHNGNRKTRDDSWGLCQQNNLSGWFNEGKLLEHFDRFQFANDFAYNAEACALMWSECSVGPWNYGNYYCSTPKELR